MNISEYRETVDAMSKSARRKEANSLAHDLLGLQDAGVVGTLSMSDIGDRQHSFEELRQYINVYRENARIHGHEIEDISSFKTPTPQGSAEDIAHMDEIIEKLGLLRKEYSVPPSFGIEDMKNGDMSFKNLYDLREEAFAQFCADHSDIAYKARVHADGTMAQEGMIVVGVNIGTEETPRLITMHVEESEWDNLFKDVHEVPRSPEWHGERGDSERFLRELNEDEREASALYDKVFDEIAQNIDYNKDEDKLKLVDEEFAL